MDGKFCSTQGDTHLISDSETSGQPLECTYGSDEVFKKEKKSITAALIAKRVNGNLCHAIMVPTPALLITQCCYYPNSLTSLSLSPTK